LLVGAAIFACYLAPSTASAAISIKIEPVSSSTSTFRGLSVEDVDGVPDEIQVVTAFLDIPDDSPDGYVDQIAVTSIAPILAPYPQGCYPPAGGAVPVNEPRYAITCENGLIDLVGIFTGAGDDIVTADAWVYPDLGLKQIDSPRVPVFMNVFLGPGRDRFAFGSGTDAVFGQAGKDRIAGGNSNDLLVGGGGADHVRAGYGNDLMVGGRGKDRCAGSGKDRVTSCERIKYREE
jgi:RTX calcium-binding nonapeptide repeat (4 copies)